MATKTKRDPIRADELFLIEGAPTPTAALAKPVDGAFAPDAFHDHTLRKTAPVTREVDRNLLVPNPANARVYYSKAELANLAASITQQGLLQPLVVRPVDGGRFEIVAGMRRYHATAPELANLPALTCSIRNLTDSQARAVSLTENIERRDISAIETAQGLQRLYDDMGADFGKATWEMVADAVKLTKTRVDQLTALLDLPKKYHKAFYPRDEVWNPKSGEMEEPHVLNEYHGRALLYLKDFPEIQHELFKEITAWKLTGTAAFEKAKALLPVVKRVGRPSKIAKPMQLKTVPKTEFNGISVHRTLNAGETLFEATSSGLQLLPLASPQTPAQRFEGLAREVEGLEKAEREAFNAAIYAYLDTLSAPGDSSSTN